MVNKTNYSLIEFMEGMNKVMENILLKNEISKDAYWYAHLKESKEKLELSIKEYRGGM